MAKHNQKILVVDDEGDILELLKYNLSKEGYEVKTLLNTNVTLMTPEPDSGIYKEQGLKVFLKRYGYPSETGEYRLSKRHKVGVKHPDTGLTLTLDYGDFHPTEKRFNFGGSISLVEEI